MKTIEYPVPSGNIKTYLHWYHLLKRIQETPFEEQDTPLKKLESLKEEFKFSDEWLWKVQRITRAEMWQVLLESGEAALPHPFTQVQYFIHYGKEIRKLAYSDLFPNTPPMHNGSASIRDYKKKREGSDARTKWPFNVLLYALLHDYPLYSSRGKYQGVLDILDKQEAIQPYDFDYNSIRRRCNRIDPQQIVKLLKILFNTCSSINLEIAECRSLGRSCLLKEEQFIPRDITISEWPIDFLTYIAHHTGYKRNPYLSREKHPTEDMIAALPTQRRKRFQKRT